MPVTYDSFYKSEERIQLVVCNIVGILAESPAVWHFIALGGGGGGGEKAVILPTGVEGELTYFVELWYHYVLFSGICHLIEHLEIQLFDILR